jgi:hypothetical protein
MLTIAAMLPALRADAEAIARRLLREPVREGREIHGRGPDGAKWGIVVAPGPKCGVWQNFGSGDAGDIFSFIRHAACDGDGHRAWQWARAWCGNAFPSEPPAPSRAAPSSPAMPASTDPAPPGNDGRRIWLLAAMMTWDDPVGRYLRGRGIDAIDRPIGALRYAAALWNDEAHARLPAMLAAVVHPLTGAWLALHRTWLEKHGGTWRKASVPTPKKSLGPVRGGVIPLLNAGSSCSLPRCAPGTRLILAEGIENALSVGQDLPEFRAAATVSAGNLLNIDLPEAVTEVLLVRDRDGEKRAIIQAREDAVACWQEEGRRVAIWEPPPQFKDANDYVRTFQGEVTPQGENIQ